QLHLRSKSIPLVNLTLADEYVQLQENSNHSILYKPVAYAEELDNELMFERHFPVNIVAADLCIAFELQINAIRVAYIQAHQSDSKAM
ncbi:MAG: hypothetical protein RR625_07400, partial [Christensenellaceae bacterium]